ncbi:hypothetical protein VTI74DRAFT_84 [Chaetomium olivicolor]
MADRNRASPHKYSARTSPGRRATDKAFHPGNSLFIHCASLRTVNKHDKRVYEEKFLVVDGRRGFTPPVSAPISEIQGRAPTAAHTHQRELLPGVPEKNPSLTNPQNPGQPRILNPSGCSVATSVIGIGEDEAVDGHGRCASGSCSGSIASPPRLY